MLVTKPNRPGASAAATPVGIPMAESVGLFNTGFCGMDEVGGGGGGASEDDAVEGAPTDDAAVGSK